MPGTTELLLGRYMDLCLSLIHICLKVPRDISTVGYDGIKLSQMLSPKLTTLRQDTMEIGKKAAKELIAAIERPKTTLVKRVIVEGSLIEGCLLYTSLRCCVTKFSVSSDFKSAVISGASASKSGASPLITASQKM